jgi:DNA-binding NarL/FixJ family response regulator
MKQPDLGYALVLEDDASWQAILEEILEEMGFSVFVTDQVSLALAELQTKSFRLLVADLSLNDEDHRNQDGLMILDAAYKKQPGCVTILLTGYATVELTVQVMKDFGAYSCLRKENFNRKAFHELILSALEEPDEHDGSTQAKQELIKKPSMQTDGTNAPVQGTKGSVLLVEDDPGWLAILSEILEEEGYLVRACTSYGQAHGLLLHEKFILAIMDLNLTPNRMGNGSLGESFKDTYPEGNRLLQLIRAAFIPVFVVSGEQRIQAIEEIYRTFNINGYFEKQNFERRLFLLEVSKAALPMLMDENRYNLTDREKQVMSLLAQGKENKEIADELFISPNTVKRHIKSVFAKMDVHSRAGAVAAYLSDYSS